MVDYRRNSLLRYHHMVRQLDHHIFNGTYGWMTAEAKPQPMIKLNRIFTNKPDYDYMNISYHHVKVKAITDTGVQYSMPWKTAKSSAQTSRALAPYQTP